MGTGGLALGRGELAVGRDYPVVWLGEQGVGSGGLVRPRFGRAPLGGRGAGRSGLGAE